MEMLVKSNKKLYRAYLLKEGLRAVFKYDSSVAIVQLDKWLGWAQRCRVEEFVELGRKIKHHKTLLFSAVKQRIKSAFPC